MALFGGNKESKEEKQARKEREALEKYGLTNLNDPDDIESVKKIISELAGIKYIELDATLSANTTAMAEAQMYYQRAMLEQNFIIIRQLDRLLKKLDEFEAE